MNEPRRLEGFIANTTRHHRLEYIKGERAQLWQQLNVEKSDGLL